MTTHFSRWLNKRIGKKSDFKKKYGYKDRDLYRWCFGKNIPQNLKLSLLLEDIAKHNKIALSKILMESHKEFIKDVKKERDNKNSKR